MNPLVSIIIPTYNRALLIAETLESVLAQTYSNWECIIVDDESKDNTCESIKSFLQDNRFKYLLRPKNIAKGANSCRNIGFEKSSGEYILWFDSDDILDSKALEICFSLMKDSNLDFCRFDRAIFYNKFKNITADIPEKININYLDITNLDQILMHEIAMGTCNVMWKKNAIGDERFNEELVYADEWEFFSRLISNNLYGISIEVVLLYVRKHQDSTTFEFRNNNLKRVDSKKEAIRLVTENLVQKELLSFKLLKYLAGLAISFRDLNLLNKILAISKTTTKNKLYLKLKFYLFPCWKIYKRVQKKIYQ